MALKSSEISETHTVASNSAIRDFYPSNSFDFRLHYHSRFHDESNASLVKRIIPNIFR